MDIVYLPGVVSLSLPAEFAAVGVAWRELFGWRQDKLSSGVFPVSGILDPCHPSNLMYPVHKFEIFMENV